MDKNIIKYTTVFKKIIYTITILGSIFLIVKGLIAYFVLKYLSLQQFILGILFFGTCLIVGILFLTSEYGGLFIDMGRLSKNKTIFIAISSLIFSFCSLYTALFYKLSFELKIISYIGFLFFGIGSVVLLRKNLKKPTGRDSQKTETDKTVSR